MVPSVEAESSSTQPMFFLTNSWVSRTSIDEPDKALQYSRMIPFTRSSSRLDDKVSSIATEVLDSILKKAMPLSGLSLSRSMPRWNQESNWLMVMRSSTLLRLLRKGGTASGETASKVSQRSRIYPWEPAGTLLKDWVPSAKKRDVSRRPTFANRSPSLRKRPVWFSSTCCSALGTNSKQVLISRQLPSIKARAMERKASRSRPIAGKTSRPNTRHSPATS